MLFYGQFIQRCAIIKLCICDRLVKLKKTVILRLNAVDASGLLFYQAIRQF